MKKELLKYIKSLEGSVLGIGITDDEILETLDNNNKISVLSILNLNERSLKNKKTENKKNKKINIKKLRKTFKSKTVDNIICDYETIEKYLKFFIKDSVYVTKKSIYIYGNINKYYLNLLKKRYSRYNVIIDIISDDTSFNIIIDVDNAKNNYFKDKYYYFIDTMFNLIEVIGDVFTS